MKLQNKFIFQTFALGVAGIIIIAGGIGFWSLRLTRAAETVPVVKQFGDMKFIIEPGHSASDKDLKALQRIFSQIRPSLENYSDFSYDDIIIDIGAVTIEGAFGEAVLETKKLRMASASPDLHYVFVHELCHFPQLPLNYPPWFKEGQAFNCQRELHLLAGIKPTTENSFDEWLRSTLIPNVQADLATWQYDNPSVGLNGSVLSYFFMKDVLKEVDLAQFYRKAREDFKGYIGELPNDAVICKMNEIAKKDLIPLFKKNGFKLEPCSDKTYNFLKSDSATPGGLAVLVMAGFWGAVIIVIVIVIKRKKRAKL
ncbi:MAG: hypothetical protein AAB797_01315 [Patescibacteria group bacterium]